MGVMVVCILGEGGRNGVICRGQVSYILFHRGLGLSVIVSLLGFAAAPGTIQHRIHYTLLLLPFLEPRSGCYSRLKIGELFRRTQDFVLAGRARHFGRPSPDSKTPKVFPKIVAPDV